MSLETAIKELQDAMTILAHIEQRQSALLKEHSERIVAAEERIAASEARSTKAQERFDLNMAEITDKLNGLIGYIAGQKPPQG